MITVQLTEFFKEALQKSLKEAVDYKYALDESAIHLQQKLLNWWFQVEGSPTEKNISASFHIYPTS